MPHEVIMPALGMAQDTGLIVCWRKGLGDAIAVGDPLFDVETDKTTMEVEAAHAGFLAEIRADAGADVPIGETIALITGVAPAGTGVDLGSEAATKLETKPSTPSLTPAPPIAPNPPAPPTSRDKPAAPSTLSAAPTILASPKARLEAHRRGIDLRRLVDQGLSQPFHVADLDRLMPEIGAAGPLAQASVLTASFTWSAFNDFVAWAEKRTGKQGMRQVTLAAFAASAFRAEVRSGKSDGLTISVLSVKGEAEEIVLRDPDLQGLGEPPDAATVVGDIRSDLRLIDLSGTKLVDYRPTPRRERLTIVITANGSDEASVNLHFCESDLPLIVAARFLDRFAARAAEPILQLL
ncbi:MAG: biotin/lipoyl-containing protein [Geminicoccaceae bacterium]